MTKSGLAVLAIVVTVGTYFSFFDHQISASHRPSQAQAVLPTSKHAQLVRPAELRDPNCRSSNDTLPGKEIKIANVLDFGEVFAEAGTLSFISPDGLIERGKQGDVISAVAIFEMLATCYPAGLAHGTGNTPRKGCPSVPPDLIANRFLILEPLAQKGHPAAQTVYAMNAKTFADELEKKGTQDASAQSRILMQNAERFAISAAGSGSKESLQFLARAYYTGLFGTRDMTSAYKYTLPLAQVEPSSAIQQHLSHLAKRITEADKDKINSEFFGCSSVFHQTSTINPFLDRR